MRLIIPLILLLALLSAVSILVGAANLDLPAVLDDPHAATLLFVSRLPRTAAVILAGAALAVAGVVMQLLVRNKFVEPGTVGTAEGAALGLLLITLLAPQSAIWAKMVTATCTAMASTMLFLTLIRRLPPQEVLLVPLVGLVYAGVLGAVVTFVAWQADLMQYVLIWLMTGEFSGVIAGRYELLWLAGLAAAATYLVADQFAILGLGKDAATGLGLNHARVMRLGLTVVSLVTAMVVVTVGMIPFVGLVVPNIVARLMGDNLRGSLPVVALGGGALVLGCDILGRLLRHPYEIPAGAVLGVVGSVTFLWLLHRRPAHG